MAGPDDGRSDGAPSHIHIERHKQPGWVKALAWLALIAGLLALVLALGRCGRREEAAPAPTAAGAPPANNVVAATPNAGSSTALAGISGLGSYLAGTEAAPRSFQFETINFDTAKSDIRSADLAEVDQVAATLKRYPTAKIRIAGYADARGSDPANAALGKARADSIKAALAAKGVEAGRIETVSGGEHDPVATNATASGRFENRRTELAVTAR